MSIEKFLRVEMISWLEEIEYCEEEYLNDLGNRDLQLIINREYDGGLSQFLFELLSVI